MGDNFYVMAEKLQNIQSWNVACKCSLVPGCRPYISGVSIL